MADALAAGQSVVALESTLLSHGLPADRSLGVAREIERAVRDAGAVPATVAVLDGTARVGLDDDALRRICTDPDVVKTSVRDLGAVLAKGGVGATTVASTAYLATRAGIGVFATGGLGGVHRGSRDSWDESADLVALAATPLTVVCAGVKSILDVPATLERLESLSVAVVGYRTDAFPGFYVRDSGCPVPDRLDSPEEVAEAARARCELGLPQALVVARPIDEQYEMDRSLHDETLESGLVALRDRGIAGKEVTPFLLAHFHERTAGASLEANVALVLSNARLAAQIAGATAPAEQFTG